MDIITGLFNSERCIVYIYNRNTKLLVTKAIRGLNTTKFVVSPKQGIVGYVFTSRRGLRTSSAPDDSHFDPSLDQFRKSTTRNMICVPIKSCNTCFGCIEIANKHESDYTDQEYQLLNSIASELGGGILSQNSKGLASELIAEKNEFKERIGNIANESLLTPLLKNVLIILAEIVKCEK